MQNSNQKFVIIYGEFNSGKSLVYNLFKKEDNYKNIDISIDHYKFQKKEFKDKLGIKLCSFLFPLIKTKKIIQRSHFISLLTFLQKEMPNYNFVIKSGFPKFLDIKEFKNLHHISVFRDVKLCWLLTHGPHTITDFISFYKAKYNDLSTYNRKLDIIIIEKISKNKTLNKLIKNTDLTQVKVITGYDIEKLKGIRYEGVKLQDELKLIDHELKDFMEYVGYDIDENIETINLILKGKINEILN